MEILSMIGLFIAGVITGAALVYYLTQNSTVLSDVHLRNNLIPNSEALQLINNKRNDDSGDLISGHMPLNVLLPYFSYLEKISKNAVVDVAGIEFYFIRYNNENNDLSFLLYPTYLSEDNEYIPFDPIASTEAIVPLINIRRRQFPNPSDSDESSILKTSTTTINDTNLVALNRANMSPPRDHTW